MRWKQFFTPVKSFSADEAKAYMDRMPADSYTLLDVRQPGEYEEGHLPGAKLIPLPDLGERIGELDTGKTTIVYCAIGGRSRIGAQMLAGKGFAEVFNLSGGIKAWNSETALGGEGVGLHLFSGAESLEETLVIAYSLEEGLREFYLSMVSKVTNENTRSLFEKLARIEVKHQDRIFNAYLEATRSDTDRDEFSEKIIAPSMEGGLTTDEYLEIYQPDLEKAEEIVSLAMAIEAQALDLYQRAAGRAENAGSKEMLQQIAGEERAHLKRLGELFENL